jgi:hypothetical protein
MTAARSSFVARIPLRAVPDGYSPPMHFQFVEKGNTVVGVSQAARFATSGHAS